VLDEHLTQAAPRFLGPGQREMDLAGGEQARLGEQHPERSPPGLADALEENGGQRAPVVRVRVRRDEHQLGRDVPARGRSSLLGARHLEPAHDLQPVAETVAESQKRSLGCRSVFGGPHESSLLRL
jgi:hypothetical protein